VRHFALVNQLVYNGLKFIKFYNYKLPDYKKLEEKPLILSIKGYFATGLTNP